MSNYFLSKGSEAAIRLLACQGGTEPLLLVRASTELHGRLTIELQPAVDSSTGFKLEAVLCIREQRHTLTLEANDGANAGLLVEWVEAIANGTLDTAEAIPQRTVCTCPGGDGSLRHPCPEHSAAEAGQWLPEDEVTLRRLARNTGSATLSTGTVVAVHGTSHAAPRTAIVVHGSQTHLVSGQWRDVYLGLSDLAEQLLTAA